LKQHDNKTTKNLESQMSVVKLTKVLG